MSEDQTNATQVAEAATAVPPAPNDYVSMVETVFHFKSEKLKDAEGKEVGEVRKIPSAKIHLPIPTNARLVEFIAEPEKFKKELELLNAAVADVIYKAARQQINELREKDSNITITASVLNLDKLDWTAIANMPKSERGSFVPTEEEVQAFCDLYKQVMPAATGKAEKTIDNHITIFKSVFKKQRNQPEFLEFFKKALAVFAAAITPEQMEEVSEVIDYYNGRLDRMLKVEEKITMDDL